ncbi:MAG: hypothetical protein ACOYKM_08450 [Caulobacterales bacterium]|jgi:hypothetical protein
MIRPAQALAALTAFVFAAGAPVFPAAAQQPQTLQYQTCIAPTPPIIPDRAPYGMSLEAISQLHDQRNAFVVAADQYRICLDNEITARRDIMFRTNAEIDPVLDVRAHEHSAISQQRAEVMGRFVLMCLSWEDQARTIYPRGCLMNEQR